MTRVRVQRVIMPWGVESATVLCDGAVVEPVERFLAHLTSIERSPNTVRAYAHDLRDFFGARVDLAADDALHHDRCDLRVRAVVQPGGDGGLNTLARRASGAT